MNVSTVHAHPTLKSTSSMLDFVFILLAIVLGAGSVLLLVVGEKIGLTVRFLGWSDLRILLWDALLSLFFFIQHSGMVRRSFRRRVREVAPAHYDGAIYAIASGIALTIVALFWQRTETEILILQDEPRTVASLFSILGLLLFIYGAASLRPFDPLGIGPIRAHLREMKYRSGPIVIRGPYRWMRHPLYAAVLLLFWSNPDVTSDRLLSNILWTVWIYIATLLEERDLTAEFGDDYLQYKKAVPMLIPWKIFRPWGSK